MSAKGPIVGINGYDLVQCSEDEIEQATREFAIDHIDGYMSVEPYGADLDEDNNLYIWGVDWCWESDVEYSWEVYNPCAHNGYLYAGSEHMVPCPED